MGVLDGKVAIVTGSNKGIGKQVAIKYAEEGAKVVLASIDMVEYPLQDVVDAINEKGGTAIGIICDLFSKSDIENTVEMTIEKFGRIDIMANIGQGGMAHTGEGLDEFTEEAAMELYKGGPIAYTHFTKACSSYMKKQAFGRILNFGSAVTYGMEGHTAYAMAKASVIALTRNTAHDLGRYNIAINAVLPIVLTGESMSKHTEKHNKYREELTKTIPARYMGTPYDDVAPLCVFLATDGARYIQGQTFNVDGGKSMQT